MKALQLRAQWHPKSVCKLNQAGKENKKAIVSSDCWVGPELELVNIPVPCPGENDVLIKVKSCGVCGSDLHCMEKGSKGYMLFSGTTRLPVILGHEFSGVVVETGKKLSTCKSGIPLQLRECCGAAPAYPAGPEILTNANNLKCWVLPLKVHLLNT